MLGFTGSNPPLVSLLSITMGNIFSGVIEELQHLFAQSTDIIMNHFCAIVICVYKHINLILYVEKRAMFAQCLCCFGTISYVLYVFESAFITRL